MQQFVEWFDLQNISKSPAKFNPEKLTWVNQQYLKACDDARLVELARPFMQTDCCDPAHGPEPTRVMALLKERVNTLEELADAAVYFYRPLEAHEDLKRQHLTTEIKPVLEELLARFDTIEWKRETINSLLKELLAAHGLKMPKVAMPLRIMVTGETQTPSVDAVLELIGRDETRRRIKHHLENYPA